MRLFDIPANLLHPSKRDGRIEGGVYAYIARGPDLEATLRSRYGRDGLCLKVFRRLATPEFHWGDTGNTLTMCTKAQNLFARKGYAPRVYDIVLVALHDGQHWAQVTDYVMDNGKQLDREACRQDVVKYYPVGSRGGDTNDANYVGGLLVDHQHHFLGEKYEAALMRRIRENTAWGSRSEPYQDIAGLQFESQRTTTHRVAMMDWDNMDFRGKTVLDVGCNAGAFCHEAALRGAQRVVGVDQAHVADTAYEIANWLGYWNVDFLGLQLPAESGKIVQQSSIEQFDMVLALSVKQVRPLEWIFPFVGDVLYFEGHVPDREETYRAALEVEFAEVEFLGMTTDHGPRPLFRCWRKC